MAANNKTDSPKLSHSAEMAANNKTDSPKLSHIADISANNKTDSTKLSHTAANNDKILYGSRGEPLSATWDEISKGEGQPLYMFYCGYCSWGCQTLEDMLHHRRYIHKLLNCYNCGFQCNCAIVFSEHLKKGVCQKSTRYWKCECGNYYTSSWTAYRMHHRELHNKHFSKIRERVLISPMCDHNCKLPSELMNSRKRKLDPNGVHLGVGIPPDANIY